MKSLRTLAALLALAFAAAAARADVQKKTLLSTDGTLYTVSTGLASELGLSGPGISPSDYAVVWSLLAQDGATANGVIPATTNQIPKTSLDLTLDEPTGTLVVLWLEENSVLNKIRLAFLKAGQWTVGDLLPNVGFPHAYNPKMLLTHQTVRQLGEKGEDVYSNRSILSVIWWEEAHYAQARYAPIFLDEAIDPSRIAVYNLPELVKDAGPTLPGDTPRELYAAPWLQAEGPGGAVLAHFVTLSSNRDYVVRIVFPGDLGKPGPDNITWQRRRIPVVGIGSQGPIAGIPGILTASVSTVIGSSYRPTLFWRDDTGLHYVRFDGKEWSAVKTIALTKDMTYDKAVGLVRAMALGN